MGKKVDDIFDDLEVQARKIMDRVGLTDDDLEHLRGLSFEEFSQGVDKVLKEKHSKK